jgi:hypothetical protein
MRRGFAFAVLLACQSGDPGAPGAPCEFTQTIAQPLGPPPQMHTITYGDLSAGTMMLAARSTCTDACLWTPSFRPANAQPKDFVIGRCATNCSDGGTCPSTEICDPVLVNGTFTELCVDFSFLLADAG